MIHKWQNTGSSNKSDPKMNRLVHDVLPHPKFHLEDLAKFNAQCENWHADDADKKSPHLNMFAEVSIGIDLPSGDKDVPSHIFDVPGLLYRRLTSVVITAINDSLATKFQLSPYKLFHESPITGEQEHVFCKIYDSDAFNKEHDKVQRSTKLPPDDLGCKCEKVIAALMFCVDCMGLVYDIQRHITQARKYVAIWVAVAHDSIYKQGLRIGSAAVEHLLKPTSSVPTVNAFIDRLGSNFPLSDMLVVDLMHEFELGIWQALFIHLIQVLSVVAPDGSLVNELDHRYRQIPTFGLSTIRQFANNTSEMKTLAVHNFEDILQCSIPPFKGLLEEPHNTCLMKLLYQTAEWHGYAKLHMHTDSALTHMEALTKEFGQLMHEFHDITCNEFQTFELPEEANA
ncbi:hypothetical protein DXG01_002775 [Tephrocybe rancida]|nr:hypothetical protein DXG01_002775 [Tephrocybe rancida]